MRILYLDALRVFATIAVVVLHTAAPFLYEMNNIGEHQWMVMNVFDSFTRWCVPIFIIISGALLLNGKSEPLNTFFKKRSSKVVIPFIGWSVFYYVYQVYQNKAELSGTSFIIAFLENDVFYHLWFLYMLLGLYLIVPILKIYVQNASNKNLAYFIALWFIGASGYAAVKKFLGISIGIDIPVVVGYVGYFVLGYYLTKVNVNNLFRKSLYIMAIVALIGTVAGTFYVTHLRNGQFFDYFYSYLAPNIIVLSIALFIFFKHNYLKMDQAIPSPIIKEISKASLGIYLLHPFILKILPINAMFIHPLVGMLFTSMLALAISYCIVRILQSIPHVKALVP
ncbi:acyltransferase [Fictibacillus sp. NRS-1165]|uniref:acyltransferase n=1 Tax=Fictibacillus sp. NRS-1165 TaxID=3144463 RepID=UPI003D248553